MRSISLSILIVSIVLSCFPGMAQDLEQETQPQNSPNTNLPPRQLGQTPTDFVPRVPLHRQGVGEEPFRRELTPFRPAEEQETRRIPPGVTILTPSGYGLSWGFAGVGVGVQERSRFTDETDGLAGVAIGFGNAQETVGLQVDVLATDLDDFGEDGVIDFKLHRRFPDDVAIAVGIRSVATWGPADGAFSPYGVITKRFPLKPDPSELFSEIHVSGGIGGGQFRLESDVIDDNNTYGVFSSVAVRVAEPVSVIAEWTGQDLAVGLSVVPFENIPLVLSPALSDITGTAGDGIRFTFGAGYALSF